ncbi:hypothetical protein [Bradyrhizobium cajani]|uniref:hypothetical protein n=1 Tax=Bradyrhizobium cajani TaxID=1928661 RepID=UPI001FE92AA7|nr:hypothetical protein [Bradyrhizobium cajani]MCP3368681.1 hypothetical protein [Bradyrhizobium cajani]
MAGAAAESLRATRGNLTFLRRICEIDYARQPGRTRGLSAADEELIEDFRNKAAGNLSDGTIKNAAADLRHLSARLSDAGRPSIADRIRREFENAQLENPDVENHQLEAELDENVDDA